MVGVRNRWPADFHVGACNFSTEVVGYICRVSARHDYLRICNRTGRAAQKHIWEVKEAIALTEAEWADIRHDTGKLFFHVVFGIPFALTYTVLCYVIARLLCWFCRLIPNRASSNS